MVNRNAPCPCGSGKRFKHCCGRDAAPAATTPVRYQALAAQRAGRLGEAETLYRRALEEDPFDVDSLHMLGIVEFERMRYREALALLWDAAERTQWAVAPIRHNLGLVVGKLLTRDANAKQADLLEAWIVRERVRRERRNDDSPLVSVVLPAYNHARYVGQAMASVAAQTYPNIELIVVDDGSSDASASVIAQSLAGFARPSRFIARENRGAPATLNEGAALANGRYLAFLNSDDFYAPERVATLVDEIARTGSRWGFSLVSNAFDEDATTPPGFVDILQKQRNFLGSQPPSFTFVEFNVAVSSGNLFVERGFFEALGGFRDHRYNHDWDFCLRASAHAEPVVVEQPLYRYRLHASNTIAESKARATADADRVVGEFLAVALADAHDVANDLSPWWPGNRTLLLREVLRGGQGALVPVPALRELASTWRSMPEASQSVSTHGERKTALVVLGMHRSGTSAMARVLNLCGAYLPEKLKPPKIGVNPKGFFEPEAVLDLNVRLMRQLGGDWSHVDFNVPDEGAIADEFVSDARDVIVSEYAGRTLIAIKDPRICMLAPLWHRALQAAGYRPAYVVPIRNPLEVAQSLHARGDMSVDEGLALWRAYMERVIAFADAHPGVLFVRYADLLDDWKPVVERIAARLGVPLDFGAEHEIERFLDRDLRNQASGDDALERLPGPSGEAVRALYRTCIERCERDLGEYAERGGTSRAAHAADRACFVLCIENTGIREQALLLCRSIRRFAGRYANAQILAYAPRPGLGVDDETRRALRELGVEYIDEPLNTSCREYPPANRVFAGAHAERHS
ncbi:MAG TPA: glycosyltransferase, partial [Casimicrobiaceae bacterium]|nr:glycosyltransferase [Casimicrobiaceae bacterium]